MPVFEMDPGNEEESLHQTLVAANRFQLTPNLAHSCTSHRPPCVLCVDGAHELHDHADTWVLARGGINVARRISVGNIGVFSIQVSEVSQPVARAGGASTGME